MPSQVIRLATKYYALEYSFTISKIGKLYYDFVKKNEHHEKTT